MPRLGTGSSAGFSPRSLRLRWRAHEPAKPLLSTGPKGPWRAGFSDGDMKHGEGSTSVVFSLGDLEWSLPQPGLIDSNNADEVSVDSVCEEMCHGSPRKAQEPETPSTSDGGSLATKKKIV